MRRTLLALALASFAAPALAAEPASPPADATADIEAAKAVLKQYLDALVKAGEGRKPKPVEVSKKLQGAKKYVHPKTLELIAAQEKKKLVTNALAVWHHAKEDYWLKVYELDEGRAAQFGTVVIEAREKNWRVAEGGEDGEWEPTSYLMAKVKDRWLLVDKRRNETFSDSAIRIGYEDYFVAPEKKEPAKKEEPAAE